MLGSWRGPGLAAIMPIDASRVYLSPHHDDVAFSLGGFVSSHPGGHLVNVFTRSSYLCAEPLRLRAPEHVVRTVTELRTSEDIAFAAATGLARRDLGYTEPPILGRHPMDVRPVEEDIGAIAGLTDVLLALAETLPEPRWLFCPLAAGAHVNHLAVRTLVLRHLPILEHNYTLAFYEDLPYARSGKNRRRALKELRSAVAPRTLVRFVFPLTGDGQRTKLDLVRRYASQHVSPPESIDAFTPKALWRLGPHEAVWLLR